MEQVTRVGIVGGGQLAMMMADAGARLGLTIDALVQGSEDPVVGRCERTVIGDARSADALRELAEQVEVITFDHELVDADVLASLETEGIVIRPSSASMRVAIDKERQFELFCELDLAQPETVVVHAVDAAVAAFAAFGGSAVAKVATGGYDGRGVLLGASEAGLREWFPTTPVAVLVQRAMEIEYEIAAQVVRAVDGTMVSYPPVRTVQSNGMCSVVHVPSHCDVDIEREAVRIARMIADAIGVIGILAVEFFVVDGELVVNELAARPHNSGHLTIEASLTSQFENHMRAVTGRSLGSGELRVAAAAMVNIVGQLAPTAALADAPGDVAVHLYGKAPRPGRKIGHVTAVAATTGRAVELAIETAAQLENGDMRS